MPPLRSVAVALAFAFVLVLGVAAPAGAVGLRRVAVSGLTCQIADPESISGVTFVNNQFVNGTWTYATGVRCTSAVADIELYQQLNLNGTKFDSAFKAFTGKARIADAIASQPHCAVCNGTWTFLWGQIVKAPSGVMFVNPPAGCITVQNGLYLECVQTKNVTL